MNDTPPNEQTSRANPSLLRPGILIATWFGAGYLPKAPGTWGSLAALPFAWYIVSYFGPWYLLIASVAVFILGIWAANDYMRVSKAHDPGPVVVDEVVGQWLTLVWVPTEITYYILGFLLFRVADIFKPWPANWADRKVGGGLGVMLDDVLAAIYSGVIVYVLYRMEII